MVQLRKKAAEGNDIHTHVGQYGIICPYTSNFASQARKACHWALHARRLYSSKEHYTKNFGLAAGAGTLTAVWAMLRIYTCRIIHRPQSFTLK